MTNPAQDLLDKYGIAPPECGATLPVGWLPLVEDLIVELIALGWDKDCKQVKVKFYGLRFYIGYGSLECYEAINKAEAKSLHTCEVCGEGHPKSQHGAV